MGGLFFPEAFVTATRQHVAERLKCSLQELYLSFELLDAAGIGGKRREDAFAITGLTLEGASWDADHGLHLSTSIRCPLPLGYLSWVSTGMGRKRDEVNITLVIGWAFPLFFRLRQQNGRVPAICFPSPSISMTPASTLSVKWTSQSPRRYANSSTCPAFPFFIILFHRQFNLSWCTYFVGLLRQVPDSVWSQRGVAFIAWSSTL